MLVTHLNDARVLRAVESVLAQAPPARQILIADGGSRPQLRDAIRKRFGQDASVRFLDAPGSVAETRNRALAEVKTDVVAFFDADELAPPDWLARLAEPIGRGEADFTGGPTRPWAQPRTGAEAYVNRAEASLYRDQVPADIALLPMGNSAWRVELLRTLGGFDARLSLGGEDYDVNLRALRSGARGRLVEEAFVFHDQSHLDSFRKVLRRKSRYYYGAALAYLKNDVAQERTRAALRRFRVRHPIDLLDLALKPWALVRARRYARRAFARAST